MGISGRKHADISADVGIPDIAVGIDSKAVRPSVVARKPESCDLTVAQAAKARTAHHSEPDCSSAATTRPLRPAFWSANLEIGKLAILQSADAIGAELQEPHRAVSADRDIGRNYAGPRQVDSRHDAARLDTDQLPPACRVAHTIPSEVTATP